MGSKGRRHIDDAEEGKRRAARKLAGLGPQERMRAYAQAIESVEREMGFKLPRFKGKMARPRPLRKAQ